MWLFDGILRVVGDYLCCIIKCIDSTLNSGLINENFAWEMVCRYTQNVTIVAPSKLHTHTQSFFLFFCHSNCNDIRTNVKSLSSSEIPTRYSTLEMQLIFFRHSRIFSAQCQIFYGINPERWFLFICSIYCEYFSASLL